MEFNYDTNIVMSGIYKIINIINNKLYIGSSKNIYKRYLHHNNRLSVGKHHNKYLQNSWNKHGEENFLFEILEIVDSLENLIEREQYWINITECYKQENGYNFNQDATRPNLNRTIPLETRMKISNSKKGVKLKPETIEKLKIIMKGENNPFYGKFHSDETKMKISEKHKGKKPTESQLSGLEMGRGSKYHTEETYRKLRDANKGEGSGTSKLSEKEVIEILISLQSKEKTQRELSRLYKVSESQIHRIKNGERWGYLKERMPELYE